MAEMQDGKNKILLFRLLREQNTSAAKLVLQTEHTFSYSRELDSIVTKDGRVVKVGGLEAEVSIEAIQSRDDEVGRMLKQAVIDGDKLELWEVTVEEDLQNEEGQYPAVYAQGYLDSWENTASAEDESTVSSNFIVELEPQEGFATLTAEQEQFVQYEFRDTTPVTDGGDGGVA